MRSKNNQRNTLNRKKFLIKSGTLLTLPLFFEYCNSQSGDRHYGKSGKDPLLNSEAEGLKEPVLKAINFGITAPNAHNTQPWKFKILNSNEFLLYVDEKRILPITDPLTRQICMSQGTFLETMMIGATGIGFRAEINLFPEGEYSISMVGKKPVARVLLKPVSNIPSDPLFSEIKDRATNRTKYFGDDLTAENIKEIDEKSARRYSHSSYILSEQAMHPYFELFYESMKLETKNIRIADESRTWFRFSDKEIFSKRDGISLPGQGVTGIQRWIAEKFFLGPEPEKFHDPKGTDLFLERYKETIESAKGIIYWDTKTNTQKDWVQAGMDYARFQLAITAMGYVIHPMSQILQEYPEMADLQKKFAYLTGVKPPSKIQMIVRIGRSDYRYFSPRRRVKEMLV